MYSYVYILIVQSHLMPPNSAARNQRKIIKSVRDRTFEYKSKEPVKTDWAQIYEMIYYLDTG
ncbi:MAG: hypothetical protein C5S49_01435 [Candidatus Methanogaster sp.]|nr:MAG: hypothetical protein C5S49_01435 [ANME-2 cluster archaeon]